MKAKRIKLAAIALLATLGVSSFAAGVGAIAKPVQAAGETPEIVNLEDVVSKEDKVSSLFMSEDFGSDSAYRYSLNELQEVSVGDSSYKVQHAIFNDLTEVKQTVQYYNADDDFTDMSEINLNANDYAGNYSVFSNVLETDTDAKHAVFSPGSLTGTEHMNKLLSFNITFENRRINLHTRDVGNPLAFTSGYNIMIFQRSKTSSDLSFFAFKKGDTVVQAYSRKTINNEFNAANGTSLNWNEMFVQGDVLNITYGAYDADDTTYLYCKIYNVTKGWLVTEKTVDMGKDPTDYANIDAQPKFKIVYKWVDNADHPNYDRSPVSIGGVYEPLLADGFNTAIEAGIEGDTVSTLTLPTGYVAKNPDQVLTAGENAVAATYTYQYYDTDNTEDGLEKTYTKDCVITVTAEGLPSYTLTLKDMSGEVIGTRSVRQGESYTFEALDREKTFVAYVAGGKLYNVGETVAVGADSEATLWEADFTIADEASVRMLANENGLGGIRWTMNLATADYEIIKDKVSVSTMIIPTDLIEGDLDYNENGAQVKGLEADDFANGTADFAVTTIRHYNYNRPFSGAAFMEVAYESGTGYVFAEAVSVSVYELALNAWVAHEAAKLEDGIGLYNSSNVAMLETYINGVIDLTVTDDGTNLTVADSNGANGLTLDAGYTATSTTQAKATEGKTTVTITITVEEGSALASLVSAGAAVPVIVRNAGSVEVYKAVEAVATAFADGTLTISAKI